MLLLQAGEDVSEVRVECQIEIALDIHLARTRNRVSLNKHLELIAVTQISYRLWVEAA